MIDTYVYFVSYMVFEDEEVLGYGNGISVNSSSH